MKMKDMFKKVEAYNEIAELMHTSKAKIQFGEGLFSSERFENYSDFKKYVRHEYIKEVAEEILNAEEWEIDGELEIKFGEGMFSSTSKFFAELVSNY